VIRPRKLAKVTIAILTIIILAMMGNQIRSYCFNLLLKLSLWTYLET
jgi:hypothetical protein